MPCMSPEVDLFSTTKLDQEGPDETWLIEPMVSAMLESYGDSVDIWSHVGRVARYAIILGRQLEMSSEALMGLQCAAMLHEIGKSLVNPALLSKSETLQRDEWYEITKHTTKMAARLRERGLPGIVVSILAAHHEHFDGHGYPLGLSGEQIPLAARVLSIADAYDAMSCARPYRKALTPTEILVEFARASGKQFDPAILRKVWPLLEAGISDANAPRTLMLVSHDASLIRQLWLAAAPHGWRLRLYPDEWASQIPPELQADGVLSSGTNEEQVGAALTLVDAEVEGSLSGDVRDAISEDTVRMHAAHREDGELVIPLDLRDVLALLHDNHRAAWSGQQARKIRVLLADPYHVFRQVLKRLWQDSSEVEVVAELASPHAYRAALKQMDFDVAVVASDLFSGTHTTAPLTEGDMRLDRSQLSIEVGPHPTIVLVADEDVESYPVALYDAPLTGSLEGADKNYMYVHRGAPLERLVEAIKHMARLAEIRER